MPYRDDRAALELRRDELRQELDAIRASIEAMRKATRARDAIERELAATEARLEHLDARRGALLERLRVASPCKASWDAMAGDDRKRFCAECGKNVYNLSAMTREEATRLLVDSEGSLCVRLYRR